MPIYSSEFSKRLSTSAGQQVVNDFRIFTNNILTYLELVLTKNVDISLKPYGPPEKRYGATFGDLTKLPAHTAPGPILLNANTKKNIKQLKNTIIGKGEKNFYFPLLQD